MVGRKSGMIPLWTQRSKAQRLRHHQNHPARFEYERGVLDPSPLGTPRSLSSHWSPASSNQEHDMELENKTAIGLCTRPHPAKPALTPPPGRQAASLAGLKNRNPGQLQRHQFSALRGGKGARLWTASHRAKGRSTHPLRPRKERRAEATGCAFRGSLWGRLHLPACPLQGPGAPTPSGSTERRVKQLAG